MSEQESSVDRAYFKLREMAINFTFKPEERLNETALTSKIGVSRTPLREALNRLVAEGFLTFTNGQGFFCRSLSPTQISELYQARAAIETEATIRGIEQATDEEIENLNDYLRRTENSYDDCDNLPELLRMDEEFHMRLAGLSNNSELLRLLANINERIRYVRMINLKQLRSRPKSEFSPGMHLSAHRVIVEAVAKRDKSAALSALRGHIERRGEQTMELVRIAYSQLYVPPSGQGL